MKFYKCENCKSVVMEIVKGDCACEKSYSELTANTVEASGEKHIPVVEREGARVTVRVGSIAHPMLEEHHIMCIYVETSGGGFLKNLKAGEEPMAVFEIPEDQKIKAVYEYCNIHGLWKTEI